MEYFLKSLKSQKSQSQPPTYTLIACSANNFPQEADINMRLTDFEIEVIKEAICKKDPNARIYIFGSRVDDNVRGGDIDILIMSDKLQQKNSREIKGEIQDEIGEQKIDIIISKDDSKPFVRIALEKGVLI